MKKIITVLIFAILTFASVSAEEIVTVYINGKVLETDTPAVVVNGSTMLPFRAIFNALGITDEQIIWDEKSSSIEVKTEDKYIFLAIGSPGAIAGNNMIMLNTMPYLENGRTMVPVRFVSESLGALVELNEQDNSVLIKN